jgi:hypothetical protein
MVGLVDVIGDAVGSPVGVSVGSPVVGDSVGETVGTAVGTCVGVPVGLAVGDIVGTAVGLNIGDSVGCAVGSTVGANVMITTRMGSEVATEFAPMRFRVRASSVTKALNPKLLVIAVSTSSLVSNLTLKTTSIPVIFCSSSMVASSFCSARLSIRVDLRSLPSIAPTISFTSCDMGTPIVTGMTKV